MQPQTALLIVDVQNDFCPGGALPVPDGDQVVKPLIKIAEDFGIKGYPVIISRDWHPEVTSHFKQYGGQWPVHCVQNTLGAEFHPEIKKLIERIKAIVINKGMLPNQDGYSPFEGEDELLWPLQDILEFYGVKELYVGGLATEYCVKAAALDAVKIERRLKVYLLLDACRGVNVTPGDSDRAVDEMYNVGVVIVNTIMVINNEKVR